ncbi:UDP-glucose--hexose-1-phosphate uridylyltransferase [Thalassotalea sp. HSM 43]|uniref:UDP-glucose--hexose-1-phosphate uridylyltransferase n=1 Tax=Thalassotalea sp. HSM 43 TaxID=2552945 RepID=UPI0010821974|nr:UDP-glucose--hexose-1-phosphate uridylyltransferase [Thalassotalea sp. HSM 43]QBY04269.1 UDP-glucose--hexose-1-phosphate uridylyltransferase [Thalassotalea sp. HSM 43]
MSQLEFTHRRKNPLTGDWVLVSPHRNNRPWSGATENSTDLQLPVYDEACPLCPGNQRANDVVNPDYDSTFVFVNDFGALVSDNDNRVEQSANNFIEADVATGECRVICFSADHNKTLPELSTSDISQVIETWQQNFVELSQTYRCVHIFENKGEVMGCSQPHPHGQIWAHNHLSSEIAVEEQNLRHYQQQNSTNLLGDYVDYEIEQNERVVFCNEHWLVVVPYWAAWPFETLLLARDDVRHMGQLNQAQKDALADALKVLTTKYDNVFNCSFPYSMGWHGAPSDLDDDSHWRLHAHFYPPLLRSATVKKHMVGYEMLAESQRDLTAEKAADILNAAASMHYKQGV